VLENYRHLLAEQNLPPKKIEKRIREVLAKVEKA
jgi:hypothetical protein